MLTVEKYFSQQIDENIKQQYKNHLINLSVEDKHSRFVGAVDVDNINRYVNNIVSENSQDVIFVLIKNEISIGYLHAFIDQENKNIEIGFSIEKEKQGKGFATFLVKEAILYFTSGPYYKYKLITYCAKYNNAVRKVLQKLGYKINGEEAVLELGV